ncbi:Fibrillin-2 [Oopsacas minuta]|uniref:Fibrillin-2 n=1 Tax=Oopsacas minuta TaxID=111878 RepID=A0AAV7JZH9_9METZ|nr:Fibrillin-2 [Oopsacas minuta]
MSFNFSTMLSAYNLLFLLLMSYTILLNAKHDEFSGYGEWEYFGENEFGLEMSGDGTFDCEELNDCEQQCFNIDNNQYCFCHRGYELNDDSLSCSDIDECNYENGQCSHICVNKIGSYMCTCELGFTREGDGISCTDINECEEKIDNCEQTCINEIGGYRCGCTAGYISIANHSNCIPDLVQPITADKLTLVLGSILIFLCLLGIIAFTIAIFSTVSMVTSMKSKNVVHLERTQANI